MTTPAEARTAILADYRVSAQGTILSPGKFEGEMLYLPYFYALMLEGEGDEVEGEDAAVFYVTQEERAAFPELGSARQVILRETDLGQVTEVPR